MPYREKSAFGDEFIRQTLELIPDNTEAMVTRGVEPSDTDIYVWPCDTHADLLETLQDLPGEPVSVGFYAPWHDEDNENMISALVPMPDGTIKRGIY